MKTITLRNVPEDLYDKLKTTAAANRRSLHSEALFRLEGTLKSHEQDAKDFLEEARKIRESINATITDEEINEGKRWGRP